jgi:hypothetical protein
MVCNGKQSDIGGGLEADNKKCRFIDNSVIVNNAGRLGRKLLLFKINVLKNVLLLTGVLRYIADN